MLRAKVVLADGREYIKEFYWEGTSFDFHHLLSGEPARYSVEALEPCWLQLFPLADLRRLPCWPAWYHHLLEVQLRIKEEKELLLLTRAQRRAISIFCEASRAGCQGPGSPDCRLSGDHPYQPEPHPQAAENARSGLEPGWGR